MNEREFSTRVRACRDKLWRVSWAILQNGADCDDALQEALIKAWQHIGTLREERYFETWLTRILINACKDILKRRAKAPHALPESAAEEAPPEHPELWDAIRALPVNERIPLVLKYVEGYRIREIAAMLRLPEATVKWRLRSAKQHMRNELK